MVMNISINEVGRGCGPCQTNASVSLSGGASMMAGGRAMGMMGHLYTWHVDNPAEVARLIKAVKTKYFGEANILTGTLGQQPMASMALMNMGGAMGGAMGGNKVAPTGVRVFVTVASQPGSAPQIAMVDNSATDMAAVIKAVAAKLHVAYSSDLSLQLAEVGSPVTDPREISANDKLVLVGGSAPPGYVEKH